MSADNFLRIVEFPTRKGNRKEYRVFEFFLSGFDDKLWQGDQRNDGLLVYYLGCRDCHLGRFETEEDARVFTEDFQRKIVVEYGTDRIKMNFPFPTKKEIAEARTRWEIDRPARDLRNQIDSIQYQIESIKTEIVYGPRRIRANQRFIRLFQKELLDPKQKFWWKCIKEVELPEARKQIAQIRQKMKLDWPAEVEQAVAELERIRAELEKLTTV